MSGNNLRATPLDGSIADRSVSTSFFDVPHQVSITASIGLPLRSRLSFIYVGSSQAPYTYVVTPGAGNSGDVNSDGMNQLGFGGDQDIVYVPRDVTPGGDISLVTVDDATGAFGPAPASEYAALDNFLTNEQCLERQRGRIMARNSCRNAWYGELGARLAVDVPTSRGRAMQFTVVVANLPGLLHLPDFNPIWTATYKTYQTSDPPEPIVPLLRLQGYDNVKQRGIYSLDLPDRNTKTIYWTVQVGVRYSF